MGVTSAGDSAPAEQHPAPPATSAAASALAAVDLPPGMELIPGFEDTIDSHFMTALLEKDSGHGAPSSAFASSAGADVGGGGNEDGGEKGGDDASGRDPGASLGLTAELLLGCDSQPSTGEAKGAAEQAPGGVSNLAGSSAQQAVADGSGASAPKGDGEGLNAAVAPSTAQEHDAGGAGPLPSPPNQPPGRSARVGTPPPPPTTTRAVSELAAATPSTAVAGPTPSPPLPPSTKLSAEATMPRHLSPISSTTPAGAAVGPNVGGAASLGASTKKADDEVGVFSRACVRRASYFSAQAILKSVSPLGFVHVEFEKQIARGAIESV